LKTKKPIPHYLDGITDVTDYLYKWQVVAIQCCEAFDNAYRDWIPNWAWDNYKYEAVKLEYVLKKHFPEDEHEKEKTTTNQPNS
jgi:hypothetical protein